ncbi:hypothetical protein B0H10DRAFT_2162326 [Mycena sp. CBHHK59/15]|nr:hypothetical protein B0H10DRAFT_2162326 [Mycena sp. CBHHK59/15]
MAAMRTSTIQEIEEHDGDLAQEIDLDTDEANPQVTFYPPLFLQRRIWILDILRRESIVDVSCAMAGPPPASIFPSSQNNAEYDYKTDMPNLHTSRLAGLDISEHDLEFAVKGIEPPDAADEGHAYRARVTRWEDLTAKVWKGGLEVVNEEFVGVECIVCTEVIEHLPPHILPAFAPTLLGIYQPKRLLLTTPSYTFNERFTRPGAPRSVRVRQGHPDPTGRTERVFRHSDHKFEWTVKEFDDWCRGAAEEWGYELEELGGVGRPMEDDPWGRDEDLGDASLVVAFRPLEGLGLGGDPHELLAERRHVAHDMALHLPTIESAKKIGDTVKAKMESFREAFIPLEQIWFEQDVSVLCGGWIEVLIWAVQEYDGLNLSNGADGFDTEWTIELVGGVKDPLMMWPEERSIDLIPKDWIPGEEQEDGPPSGSVSSTGADDGDVSWNESDIEEADETWTRNEAGVPNWGEASAWGEVKQDRGTCDEVSVSS